jgi:hypothetical protein
MMALKLNEVSVLRQVPDQIDRKNGVSQASSRKAGSSCVN